MKTKLAVIFIGPSGSGKSTAIAQLEKMGYIPSKQPLVTYRKPRKNEDQQCVDEATFNDMLQSDQFAYTCEGNGNTYGLPIDALKEEALVLDLKAKHIYTTPIVEVLENAGFEVLTVDVRHETIADWLSLFEELNRNSETRKAEGLQDWEFAILSRLFGVPYSDFALVNTGRPFEFPSELLARLASFGESSGLTIRG